MKRWTNFHLFYLTRSNTLVPKHEYSFPENETSKVVSISFPKVDNLLRLYNFNKFHYYF